MLAKYVGRSRFILISIRVNNPLMYDGHGYLFNRTPLRLENIACNCRTYY